MSNARLAQSVERTAVNRVVTGSNPVGGSKGLRGPSQKLRTS